MYRAVERNSMPAGTAGTIGWGGRLLSWQDGPGPD
jgi:hypothetical protein